MIGGRVDVDMAPLEGLKKSLVGKILRTAVTKAATPVRQQVKSNAQAIAVTGYLAKSISSKIKTGRDGVIAIIGPKSDYVAAKPGTITRGPRKGQSKRYTPSNIAPLVERGTKHSKPNPFLAPALAQMQAAFQSRVAELIAEGIAQQLA